MLDANQENIWNCLVCKVNFNHNNIPFTLCDDVDLNNINNSNSMKYFEKLPSFPVMSVVDQISRVNNNDIDCNIPFDIDCEYYAVK